MLTRNSEAMAALSGLVKLVASRYCRAFSMRQIILLAGLIRCWMRTLEALMPFKEQASDTDHIGQNSKAAKPGGNQKQSPVNLLVMYAC